MSRAPDAELSRAVLIGISDYERSDKLPDLPAVRNNLSGIESALTDSFTGVFLPQYCSVVDSPDSPRSLMRRLTKAADTAEDVLLVYYAGHGTLDRKGDLHLTVRETDPDPYGIEGTAVPFSWIRRVVEDSPAKIRVLILDCCFSGQAIGAMSPDSAALQQIKIDGTYILASSEASKVSVAVPGERYTAFTGELLALLSGPPTDPPITLSELNRRLRAALARRNLPSPMSRAENTSGDLILRRQVRPVGGVPVPPAAVVPQLLPGTQSPYQQRPFMPAEDGAAGHGYVVKNVASKNVSMPYYKRAHEGRSPVQFRASIWLAWRRLNLAAAKLRTPLQGSARGYAQKGLEIAGIIALCMLILFCLTGISVWIVYIIQGFYSGGLLIITVILTILAAVISCSSIVLLLKLVRRQIHRHDRKDQQSSR